MTQKFKVGQTVSGDDYARLPVGSKVCHGVVIWVKVTPTQWETESAGGRRRDNAQMAERARDLNFVGTDAPEPEDTDDAYVEPEPLKEGDWVQVWAQVERLRSDGDTICRFFYGVEHEDGTPKDFFGERVRDDAIVRPDAGQVPPWAKPVEEPMGLGAVVEADVVHRRRFVRVAPAGFGASWCTAGIDYRYAWSDLKDPRVIAPGITEGGAS